MRSLQGFRLPARRQGPRLLLRTWQERRILITVGYARRTGREQTGFTKKRQTVASAFIMEYIKAGEERETSKQEAIKPIGLDKKGKKKSRVSGLLSERGDEDGPV